MGDLLCERDDHAEEGRDPAAILFGMNACGAALAGWIKNAMKNLPRSRENKDL